jgi:hypothetical protein
MHSDPIRIVGSPIGDHLSISGRRFETFLESPVQSVARATCLDRPRDGGNAVPAG